MRAPALLALRALNLGDLLVAVPALRAASREKKAFGDAVGSIGLLIAFVAVKEGREAWRGEGCCAPTVDDCC